MLSNQVWDDEKLRQLPAQFVKRTVMPRWNSGTELWTRNTKARVATLSLNSIKTKMDSVSLPALCLCCCLQCLVNFYRCKTPFTNFPHKDLDAEQIRIKYVYGHVQAPSARLVRSDDKPQNDGDIGAAVPVRVCIDGTP